MTDRRTGPKDRRVKQRVYGGFDHRMPKPDRRQNAPIEDEATEWRHGKNDAAPERRPPRIDVDTRQNAAPGASLKEFSSPEHIKAWCEEAAKDVEEWGAYASEYFQEKWNLVSGIQKWRDRANVLDALVQENHSGDTTEKVAIAHSKSEYKRLSALGANVMPPIDLDALERECIQATRWIDAHDRIRDIFARVREGK